MNISLNLAKALKFNTGDLVFPEGATHFQPLGPAFYWMKQEMMETECGPELSWLYWAPVMACWLVDVHSTNCPEWAALQIHKIIL